jgi:type II secretion system protein N
LDFSLIPSPGLNLKGVTLETTLAPSLKAASLVVRPSLLGLLTFKPGVSAVAEGFWGGNLNFSTRGAGKNSAGHTKQNIDIEASRLKLNDIINFLEIPIRASGLLEGGVSAVIDNEGLDQPSGEATLELANLSLEETDLNLQGMPLSLPKISLGQTQIEAKLDKGQVQIQKLVFGKGGQDLSGMITGHMGLTTVKQGQGVGFVPGAYEFFIKLQVGESLKQKAGIYLGVLQNYLVAQNTYSIKLSGANFYAVPSMTKGPN